MYELCEIGIYFLIFNENKVMSVKITSSATAFRFPVATATCPSGTSATGGGGSCISLGQNGPPIGWVWLVSSDAIGDNQWRVSCDTPKDQYVTAQATIFCS